MWHRRTLSRIALLHIIDVLFLCTRRKNEQSINLLFCHCDLYPHCDHVNMDQLFWYNSIMNMRQGQFHHFINEFNYLYQQTKTVSLPPSLSPYHLLYPTVLFPTMTFYPQAKVIIEQGHSKLKTKCDRSEDIKNNIKIAHLVSSSLRKESGVQRIMSIVCQHTYNPCSCAKKKLLKRICEADTQY